MSLPNQHHRNRATNPILSVSGPVLDRTRYAISDASNTVSTHRTQISAPRNTHPSRSGFAHSPLELEITYPWSTPSSGSSEYSLPIAHNPSSNKTNPLHALQTKPVSLISRDTDDNKTPVANPSKYQLVFSRNLRKTERHPDRDFASTNVARSTTFPAQIPSKPFRCPKAHCNRTFSSQSALNYHSKHGYCSSLDLSQIYPSSSSLPKLKYPGDEDGIPMHSSPADISPSTTFKRISNIPALVRNTKIVGEQSQNFVSNRLSTHVGSVHSRPPMDRARSRRPLYRSTSMPNSHKPNPTLPSWLIVYPPPPPFGSKSLNPKKEDPPEDVFSGLGHKIIRRTKSHSDERIKNERGQRTVDSSHLSRALSTSRPSERDPVLGRPYSQFPSRPSPMRTFSGTSPTPTGSSSVLLRPPTSPLSSSHSSTKPIKNTTSSRLANPLPLPPNRPHVNPLRAAREREWGRIENRNSGNGNPHALSPRTPSPQISYRRYSRPPSPRPSSLSSSVHSFSRRTSISSLSRPSSSPSLRYSPRSSPSATSLSTSFIRSSTPFPDLSPSPRSTRSFPKNLSITPLHDTYTPTSPIPSPRPPPRLPVSPTPRVRPTSWREKVRRGFWNRRGDYLTEDGFIVYAPPDRAFPYDLATYPAETEGYQDHELEFTRFTPRPELPESLPRRGRPPERPYDSFIIYVHK